MRWEQAYMLWNLVSYEYSNEFDIARGFWPDVPEDFQPRVDEAVKFLREWADALEGGING